MWKCLLCAIVISMQVANLSSHNNSLNQTKNDFGYRNSAFYRRLMTHELRRKFSRKLRKVSPNLENRIINQVRQYSSTAEEYFNLKNQAEGYEVLYSEQDIKGAINDVMLSENEVREMLPRVAWYLRQHKFYDYDHRLHARRTESSVVRCFCFQPLISYP